jgi:drug/metabolite transporter (DMT)-like permease
MRGTTAGYALLVLLAGSSYGLVSPLLKQAYRAGFTTVDVTDAQYVFAAALLWLIALISPRRRMQVDRQQWAVLIGLGLTGAATTFFYYLSLSVLPASLGIVLLFQFSWVVLVIDILVTRRLPGAAKWAGVALIVVGTVLAVGGPSALTVDAGDAGRVGTAPFWAIVCGLIAAISYAGTLYLSSYADPAAPAALRAAIVTTCAGVLVIITFPPVHLLTGGTSSLWFWGLLVALASQVVPTLLLLVGAPRTGGRMAGVLGSIELPVAVLAAHLWLGEAVSPLRWAGVLMILAGIAVSEWDVFVPRRAA